MDRSRKGFYGAITSRSESINKGPSGVYREFQAQTQFTAAEENYADRSLLQDDSETEQLLQPSPPPDRRSFTRGQSAFCDNEVTTSKYTVVTFIPRYSNFYKLLAMYQHSYLVSFGRSLLEQFRRVANLYFLIMSMLMLIGTYSSLFDSPITPWSTLATLFIVLSISMTKEALEDIKRQHPASVRNR